MHDCDTKVVVLVKDKQTGMYTSTFKMYVDEQKNLYVRKIATTPKVEGKGIGRKNMSYMEAYAKNVIVLSYVWMYIKKSPCGKFL